MNPLFVESSQSVLRCASLTPTQLNALAVTDTVASWFVAPVVGEVIDGVATPADRIGTLMILELPLTVKVNNTVCAVDGAVNVIESPVIDTDPPDTDTLYVAKLS